MKRAYIVAGPESSGTRMAAKILIAAGCHGESGLGQKFDNELPSDLTPIVWRRSSPHGGEWPRLIEMARKVNEKGYLAQFVITSRDWYPMACSQVHHEHVRYMTDAYKNIEESYIRTFDAIKCCKSKEYIHPTVPYVMFHYEALASDSKGSLGALMPMLELPVPEIEIYNGNEKWYKGEAPTKEAAKASSLKGGAVVKSGAGVVLLGER